MNIKSDTDIEPLTWEQTARLRAKELAATERMLTNSRSECERLTKRGDEALRKCDHYRVVEVPQLKTEIEQLTRSRDYFQREMASMQIRLSEFNAPYDQAMDDFLLRACEALKKPGLSFNQVMYEIEKLKSNTDTNCRD